MSGAGILFALLAISSIPAIAVFLWYRFARCPISPTRFAVALLAGAASFFPALLLQYLLAPAGWTLQAAGRWGFIAEMFIRIALTEELSRLVILAILFQAIRRFFPAAAALSGASGLVAGLGFAIIESAAYGASNSGIVLIRAFTSAPLHGACGFRVGSSIALFSQSPAQGIFRFLSAVVIHGVYNLMLERERGISSIAAILIALSAFAISVIAVRNEMRHSPS